MKEKNVTVPVTGMEPNGEVTWCVTKGWGNLKDRETEWRKSKNFEAAVQEIAAYAKKVHPGRFNEVWTYSFTDDGVICDWGDYTYFGFVEGNCNVQAPAPEVPAVPSGRPEKECSVPEYLESDDGRKLSDRFKNFLDFLPSRLSWWQAHALAYCLLSEWWSMFCNEEPDIVEIWVHDLSPDDIFEHVKKWAANDPDGAEILLQTHSDWRWDAFHRAFTWGEE